MNNNSKRVIVAFAVSVIVLLSIFLLLDKTPVAIAGFIFSLFAPGAYFGMMYMTAAGINVAKLAAEVYNSDGDDVVYCNNEHFWHHVPKSVAYAFTEDEQLVKKAKELAA